MGNWRCSKCGNSTFSNNKPLVGVCAKGGGHVWRAADGVKAVIWRCGKCGNTTTGANRPLSPKTVYSRRAIPLKTGVSA